MNQSEEPSWYEMWVKCECGYQRTWVADLSAKNFVALEEIDKHRAAFPLHKRKFGGSR